METATKQKIAEVKQDLAKVDSVLQWSLNHLAKYPNDTITADYVRQYVNYISRATKFLRAVDR